MLTIILLSFLGAVLAIIIGTVWYMPFTPMGRVHMQYLGFDKLSKEEQDKKIEEAKPHMRKSYLGQTLLSFLTSFFVVFMMTKSLENGESFKMVAVYLVMTWGCFMVPVIGSNLIWGNCDRAIVWKKFFYDIMSNLVTILVIVGVTSLFL